MNLPLGMDRALTALGLDWSRIIGDCEYGVRLIFDPFSGIMLQGSRIFSLNSCDFVEDFVRGDYCVIWDSV